MRRDQLFELGGGERGWGGEELESCTDRPLLQTVDLEMRKKELNDDLYLL